MRSSPALPVLVASACLALAPGSAEAQYPSPPPDFSHPSFSHNGLFNPVGGTTSRPMLVIYTQYDSPSHAPGRTAQWLAGRFFGSGYTNVAGWYRANSFGRLQLTPAAEGDDADGGADNDGVVVANVGNATAYLEPADLGPGTDPAPRWNRLSLQAADTWVDFASFDRNGDNSVTNDELTVVNALTYAPTNPGWTPVGACTSTRPHEPVTLDDKTISLPMAIVSENTNMMTSVHEVGHAVTDMRDLYATPLGNFAAGPFALEGATCGAGDQQFWGANAWEKMHLGWERPTVVTRDGYYDVLRASLPLGVGEQAPPNRSYILYDPAKGENHYYMVENRAPIPGTYDQDVTDSGLLIWRVDERNWASTTINLNDINGPTQPYAYGGEAWDPSDPNTPQRTMDRPWGDGTPAGVAVRAIGPRGDSIRAFFDVRGPGILVDCWPPSPASDAYVGETGAVRLPVRNTSETAETFEFTLAGLPAGWGASPARLFLQPGQESLADFPVTIPQEPGPGPFAVSVHATSVTGPAVGSSCGKAVAPSSVDAQLRSVGMRGTVRGYRAGLAAVGRGPGGEAVAGAPITFQISGRGRSLRGIVRASGPGAIARWNPVVNLPVGRYRLRISMEQPYRRYRPASLVLKYTVSRYVPWMDAEICQRSICGPPFLNPLDPVEFRGLVWPSDRNDVVRFSYRAAGSRRWTKFGKANRDLGDPMGFTRRTAVDRIDSKSRFGVRFIPLEAGRYTVRVTFPAQDGLRRRSLTRLIRVR